MSTRCFQIPLSSYVYCSFLSLFLSHSQPSDFPSSLPSFQNIKHPQHTKVKEHKGECVFWGPLRSMVPSPYSGPIVFALLCSAPHMLPSVPSAPSPLSSPHLDFLNANSCPSWTLHNLGYSPSMCFPLFIFTALIFFFPVMKAMHIRSIRLWEWKCKRKICLVYKAFTVALDVQILFLSLPFRRWEILTMAFTHLRPHIFLL